MGHLDKRVDAYIARSADFAQPILNHLRQLIHRACPDITETLKWAFPHFEHLGIVCSMAAFQHHCAFGFWKASIMSDPHHLLTTVGKTAMGHLGQLKDLADLPPDKLLIAYTREAVALNEKGIKLPKKPRPAGRKALSIPGFFTKALRMNAIALKTFNGFSYSNKKEYVEWVTEAKTEETRNRRLATSIEWIARGKTRNWKYIPR